MAEVTATLPTPQTFDVHAATYFVHITDRRRNAKPGATRIVSVRANGQTKLWKTRPNDFRIPVKYGLRDCFYITPANAHRFHTSEEAAAKSEAGRYIDC